MAERMTVTFEKTCLGDLQEGERAVREDPEDGLLLVLHHKIGGYCVFTDRDGNSAGGIHGANWEGEDAALGALWDAYAYHFAPNSREEHSVSI